MLEVEGIIVNETKYGETSKVLNILTKTHGLIGVMAKGANSLKSPLRSTSTKLTYGFFIIYYKKGKLSILKEVTIINHFKKIKKDIEKISISSYLLELSESTHKQNNNPNIYKLLIETLLKIEEGYNPKALMNILELKYLYYLGVAPILDECAICGKKVHIITLSSYKGGFICQNWYQNEKIVSEKVIKLIRLFYHLDISKINKLSISKEIEEEINNFLNDYYTRYTGLYLKSKDFLKNLSKISY